jgi:hypothetical protein
MMRRTTAMMSVLVLSCSLSGRPTTDPFPEPIRVDEDVIGVSFAEFAVIPDADGEAPRMMHMADEPGTSRLFVSTMHGMLYSLSYDGKTVRRYLDINQPSWGIGVQYGNSERGFQSFAFHPQFNERGRPGYGKLYTYTDTTNTTPRPDFTTRADTRTHDTVLLEWSAKDASAPTYDGRAPRELFRVAQPYGNHNGGEVAFNPLAKPGDPDFGLLYVGSADGGSGGDPHNMSQDLASIFGKILRIDPLATTGGNGRYGIPAANPFAMDESSDTLGEIYAYGVRNPQRYSWDVTTGRMFVADIGQNAVEEISPVTAGANLGWNRWEGSFAYANRQVDPSNQRSEPGLTWPIVEYDHDDPLFRRVAITGVYIYRQPTIPQLQNLLLFGDNPSGEIFYVHADRLPEGGQDAIRRILLKDKGTQKTLLELIREKNAVQGRPPAQRADLRFGQGPNGQIFILNKRDGVIRALVPDGSPSMR